MASVNDKKRYSQDFKRVRMLNYLYDIRPCWIVKYSLFNLPKLNSQSWSGGGLILKSLLTERLVIMAKPCKPSVPNCILYDTGTGQRIGPVEKARREELENWDPIRYADKNKNEKH